MRSVSGEELPRPRRRRDRLWLRLHDASRPRRVTFGEKLAGVGLVLLLIGNLAYTRAYVARQVESRVAQSCASYGADLEAFRAQLDLLEEVQRTYPTRLDVGKAIEKTHRAIEQKRLLRDDVLHCPPYPPPPDLPQVPAAHR